jgi:trigger factor
VKSSVETLDPTRVRLTVEVPFDELKPSLDSAYKRIAAQITIPGFRKGRVPAMVIDQRVGRAAVLEEAVNDYLPKAYSSAVDEHQVKPLGQPELDITPVTDGGDLTFTAEVDIRPDIVLPDYTGIPVTVEDAVVTDDDVQQQLRSLQGRFATLTTVDRAAADGDYVSIDLATSYEGEPIEDATANGLSYEVGTGQLLDGLDAALVGLSAGESALFQAPLQAGEHTDHNVDVTVTVQSVRERELPHLDDDFAQMASEFDTLDELTADLRRRLEAVKRIGQGVQARDKVLEELLTRVDVPLPERLLQAQVSDHFDDGHGDDDHRAEFEKQAREALTAQFVLDEIATKESLSVGEGELSEYIVRNAPRYGLTPDDFANQIVSSGQVPAVIGEVVRAKALAFVLEHAVVTDESGEPVDLEALRDDPALSADA